MTKIDLGEMKTADLVSRNTNAETPTLKVKLKLVKTDSEKCEKKGTGQAIRRHVRDVHVRSDTGWSGNGQQIL